MQFITNDLASSDSIIATTTTANTIVETGVLALYTRDPVESQDTVKLCWPGKSIICGLVTRSRRRNRFLDRFHRQCCDYFSPANASIYNSISFWLAVATALRILLRLHPLQLGNFYMIDQQLQDNFLAKVCVNKDFISKIKLM